MTTEQIVKDHFIMHYVYYFNNNQQKGEGFCYLSAQQGFGIRQADINGAVAGITKGLVANLKDNVVVVPTCISYLSTCPEEDFMHS